MLYALKKITQPVLKRLSAWYLSKPRKYRYKQLYVWVEPGVFHPFFTISTKVFLDFIEPLDLRNKVVLELGCGCGIISLLAADKGAQAIASDINTTALEALKKNAALNDKKVDVLYSDLFAAFPDKRFDYILINPPYYAKDAASVAEQAWFCGKDFDYFQRLFMQLPSYIRFDNFVYMILSQDCNLEKIMELAAANGLHFQQVLVKKVEGERNYIYRIEAAAN